MTDSSAVAVRPTQAEAWRKYAVTAVSPHSISAFFRSAHGIPFRLPWLELSSPLMCF